MSKIRILTFFFSAAPLFYGFYGTTIFEKTDSGACRSLFLIEMSNAARNFSNEDGVYVARSQKSLKVGEKISVEKWKIMVLSK